MLFGPEAACERWLADLEGSNASVQIGRTVAGVISALVDDPPPRPQLLVLDLDALTPGELMELHSLRDLGWTGMLVVEGQVPRSLAVSLRIEYVLSDTDTLRGAVASVDHAKATRRIPLITG